MNGICLRTFVIIFLLLSGVVISQTGTYTVQVCEQNNNGSVDKWTDTIWVDSVFIGSGFSHGNYFSKCNYKVLPGKGFYFEAGIIRADTDGLTWSGSVKGNKIKGKAEWRHGGKVKTTYHFKGKKVKS